MFLGLSYNYFIFHNLFRINIFYHFMWSVEILLSFRSFTLSLCCRCLMNCICIHWKSYETLLSFLLSNVKCFSKELKRYLPFLFFLLYSDVPSSFVVCFPFCLETSFSNFLAQVCWKWILCFPSLRIHLFLYKEYFYWILKSGFRGLFHFSAI